MKDLLVPSAFHFFLVIWCYIGSHCVVKKNKHVGKKNSGVISVSQSHW